MPSSPVVFRVGVLDDVWVSALPTYDLLALANQLSLTAKALLTSIDREHP